MSRISLYRDCVRIMTEKNIESPEFDTLCIFQNILKEKNPLLKPEEEMSPSQIYKIYEDVEQRCEGVPLQYILGEWDFWSYTFQVWEGVLIPRPETETLVENIIDLCREESLKSPKIVDLCSGSGCIAVTLDKEIDGSKVWAVEKFDKAFEYLEKNIVLNSSKVHAVKADVLLCETAENFENLDIIVSNPPYLTAEEMNSLQREVRYEPETALYGGADGLDFYRGIIPLWRECLRDGGYICLEFGDGQHEKVGEILLENGFCDLKFTNDSGNIVRTVRACKGH